MKLKEPIHNWIGKAVLLCIAALSASPGISTLYGQTQTVAHTNSSLAIANKNRQSVSIKTPASSEKLSYCYIQGPTYVDPGISYFYNLACFWDQPSYMYRWEVVNGTKQDYWDASSTYITWDRGAMQGYINVYDDYNGILVASLTVFINFVEPLNPGSIISGGGEICAGSVTPIIDASPASGGSCYNQFNYQWQVSFDNAYWYDLPGEYGVSYSPGTANISAYYRRAVNCSNEIAYTNAVYVNVTSTPAAPNTPVLSYAKTFLCNGESLVITANGGNGNYVWSNGYTGNQITVNTAGTYSVYCTPVSNSCGTSGNSGLASITISTGNAPAPPSTPWVTADNSILCNISSTKLRVYGGNGSYRWSTGESGSQITIYGPGTYSVYCTPNSNACGTSGNSASASITISSGSAPAAPATPGIFTENSQLCVGSSKILTAYGGNGSYVWSTGQTGNQITITSPGTYSVYCTPNSNACGTSGNSGWGSIYITSGSIPSAPTTPSLTADRYILCDESGTILRASGGNGNYIWSTGQTGSQITVYSAGVYTVYCAPNTNDCGSSASSGLASVSIGSGTPPSQPSTPNLSFSTTLLCDGASTLLTASGGNGNYIWSTGQTGSQISVNTAGNYSVYCTPNTNACGTSAPSGAASVYINTSNTPAPPSTPYITYSGNTLLCNGASITLTANGGNGNYVWSNGQTGSQITVNSAGTYSVYCSSNSNACGSSGNSGSASINITTSSTPNAPILIASGSLNICGSESVNLTTLSGTGLKWYRDGYFTGETASTINVTTSRVGNFYVTASNACGVSGNSNTLAVTFGTAPTAPVISSSGSTLLCNGSSIVLTSATPNVLWNNGTIATSITVNAAGTYYATKSNSCGTSPQSNAIYVSVSATPGAPSIVAGKYLLCDGESTTLVASGAGRIDWYNQAGTYLSSGTNLVVNAAGNYYADVTNSCGTSSRNFVSISTGSSPVTPSTPGLTAGKSLLCNGESTILSASGGNGSYVWSTGQTGSSITVSTAGTYSVYCTPNSNACGTSGNSGSASVYISTASTPSAPTTPVLSYTKSLLCNGESVVLFASGGNGNYVWSNGGTGSSITVSSAGTYSVYCTPNSNACGTSGNSASASVYISTASTPSAPTTPVLSYAKSLLCNGESVVLSASGGNGNYVWSNGGTGSSITVSTAGTYSVYCTPNSNACGTSGNSASASVYISTASTPSAPTTPILSYAKSVLCNGESVVLSASGGNGSYVWSTGQTGSSITVSSAGTYSVYCTPNSNACGTSGNSASASVYISTSSTPPAPTTPILSYAKSVLCNGESVVLSASGGNGNYVWSNGGTGSSITVSTAGTYSVYCTPNSNACGTSGNSGSASVYISTASTPSAPTTPVLSYAKSLLCNGESVVLSASGGNGNYVWSNGGTGSSITVSSAGTYSVYCTPNSNACGTSGNSGSASVYISTASTPPAPTTPVLSYAKSLLCNGESVVLSASGGNGSYVWSTGQTGSSITVSSAGTYSVYCTPNSNSCGTSGNSGIASVNITTSSSPAAPTISASGTTLLCNGASVTLTSSISNVTWNNGTVATSITVTAPGSYYATQNNGCGASLNSNVIVVTALTTPTAPTLNAAKTVLCNGESVTITASGTGNISWYNQAGTLLGTGASLSVNTAGTYYADATNACGISSKNSITITAFNTPLPPEIPTISKSSLSICTGSSVTLTANGGNEKYVWSTNETTKQITIFAPGTYSVYCAANSNACGTSTPSASTTVTITDGGSAESISFTVSGIDVLCAGQQTQFVSTGTGGTWESSNPSMASVSATGLVSAIQAGVVEIRYTITTPCNSKTIGKSLIIQSSAPTTTSNKPVSTSKPILSAPSIPQGYDVNATINYVRTRSARSPITDISQFEAADYQQVQQVTQYIDGLGRPLQTVAKQTSPLAKDIVNPVIYDEFGREAQQYLPYASANSDGKFKANPFAEQSAYMGNRYPDEQFYFGKTEFENSPLNRPTKTMAPGNSWVGNGRGISYQYLINTDNDGVRIWDIGYDPLQYLNEDVTTNLPVSSRAYPAGELTKKLTLDEQGNAVVEFTDKDGHVILKKVQADCGAGDGHTGWFCTYYVYDDFGQLRFVLPPKMVENLNNANNWDLVSQSQSVKELCFRYEYDARNRMIAKKVPGAGWVYMVYDKRDRLAYTQDANMRSRNQWLITLYDELNRPVATGMIVYTGTRDDLQNLLDRQFDEGTPTIIQNTINPQDILYVSERVGTQSEYRAQTSIVFTNNFSSPDGDAFETILGTGGGTTSSVNMNYNPLPPNHQFIALTYQYYDTYSFTSKKYATTHISKLDDGGNPYPETLPTSPTTQTLGMPTIQKVRILSDPNNLAKGGWLETVTFYDDKGRPIQVQSDNIKSGIDQVTNRYNFEGKVITSYEVHSNPAVSTQYRIKTNMLYDHAGRLLSLKKTINDNAADSRILSRVAYDEMGQMKEKQLGQKQATDISAMELQQYDYTIRGWLAGINKNYTEATSTVPGANTAWFGMKLSYDNGFEVNQFNGNIAGTVWRSRGDGSKRAYGFGYDRLNRLLFADFNQLAGSSWDKSAGIDFTSRMGDGMNHRTAYDANGNILRMQQWGLRFNQSVQIDDLSYDYFGSSNKLKSVFDAMNDPTTTLGDFRTATGSPYSAATSAVAKTDYDYDANGNLLKDLNKEIGDLQSSGIQYNHLNLPYQVAINNKGTITYIYDATGRKLEKQTLDNTAQSKTTKTAYIGGYVFQDDVLQFIGNEEGRARPKDNGFVFDYFIKDHLGNTRMVLTDEQQTDAYPVASMETANAASEKLYYTNIDETRSDKPAGYPDDTYTNPNDKVARLNGNSKKIGPAILLKVMSGDQMNIRANAYYRLNGASVGTPSNPASELLAALANSIQGATGGKFGIQQVQSSGVLGPGISDLLQRQTDQYTGSTRPKAFLNWILLDEQFKIVNSSSGFEPVGGDGEFKTFIKTGLPISQNGYLYVYTSNESPVDVFFDNLQVTQNRGPLLEETHYYPFGLTMAGISSKAAGKLENRYKFVGKELDEELGWNTYQMMWRTHDPQIGRFLQVDPLASKYVHNSTYAYAENDVIRAIDVEGLEKYVMTFRAFIPQPKVSNPVPFRNDVAFKGDNRTEYQANASSYRTEQKVSVDFDNHKMGILNNTASTSTGLDKNGHAISHSSEASAGTITGNNEAFSKGAATANINFDTYASNQLVATAPAIDAILNVSITPSKDGSFNFAVKGATDGFPAYELWVTDEKGKSFLLMNSNPIESGKGPISLFPPLDQKYDFKGNSKDVKKGPIVKFNSTTNTHENKD